MLSVAFPTNRLTSGPSVLSCITSAVPLLFVLAKNTYFFRYFLFLILSFFLLLKKALEPPFQGENLIALGFNIVNKFPKPLPSIYSPKLV